MPIQNGLGFTGYADELPRGFEGAWADYQGGRARPCPIPLLSQISNIEIGGFGADTDAVTVHVDLPNGARVSNVVTRAAGVPVDDAAAAVALAALINADEDLNGHVVATTSTVNLILTFVHANVVYPVTTAVVGSTAAVTTTRAAGGSALTVGRFVSFGASIDGQPAAEALAATDGEWDVMGITLRSMDLVNAESPLASAVDQIPAGNMCAVAYKGNVYMRNNGSVAAAPNGTVYVVRSATGGDEVGEARADESGVAQVATITATADKLNYEVDAAVRVNGELRTLRFSYQPTDATTTTDEAIDGLEDAAAAAITAQGLTGIVAASAASAAATMTLTTAAGYTFEYVDGTAFGLDAETEALTVSIAAAALYAIAMDRKRAHWTEATPVGEIGPIALDL
jgi:hypothetical protein